MKKVLVIEDNKVQASILSLSIKSHGYDVVHVDSGEAALRVLEKDHDFALITLDINLVGMSGLQFLAYLRKEKAYNDIPIVIITALRHEKYLKEARVYGVNDYYVKPISFSDLNSIFKVYLP